MCSLTEIVLLYRIIFTHGQLNNGHFSLVIIGYCIVVFIDVFLSDILIFVFSSIDDLRNPQ